MGQIQIQIQRRNAGVLRAPEQGNTPPNPRGRHLSRRQVRAHAGGRPPEVRRRQRMEIAPLPGRVASQGAVMLTAGEFAQNC